MTRDPSNCWRNRLKVLPLEPWMRRESAYCKEHGSTIVGYKMMRPAFNREGAYFDRLTNQSWFEVNGLAFTYNTKQFKHDLYILEVLSTCKRKIAVLEAAMREGAATSSVGENLPSLRDEGWHKASQLSPQEDHPQPAILKELL